MKIFDEYIFYNNLHLSFCFESGILALFFITAIVQSYTLK